MSLRLEPGSRVALDGPERLGQDDGGEPAPALPRPRRGRVTLEAAICASIARRTCAAPFALAGQDAHLFSTSIRQNVLLGRPDASDEELEDALGQARIWDWVQSLPEGWDTMVGENGRELSGGQRSASAWRARS